MQLSLTDPMSRFLFRQQRSKRLFSLCHNTVMKDKIHGLFHLGNKKRYDKYHEVKWVIVLKTG